MIPLCRDISPRRDISLGRDTLAAYNRNRWDIPRLAGMKLTLLRMPLSREPWHVFQKRRQISSRPGSVSHVNTKNKNLPRRDIPAKRDHVNRPLQDQVFDGKYFGL